ncbi:MAG: oxidoreductase [Marmoricola sp.]|nr:oxidoreductase [Marmoricola sp.]
MIAVGVSVHDSLMTADPSARRHLLQHAHDAGLDHVTVGDHVSFHGGTGFDGLVAATAVLATHDETNVLVGVYQLALRHPVLAARQLSSISQIAPGRLVLGVGVGGEDRSEVTNSGVDPSTRGRRLDESLGLLRRLATGETVDHSGEFFTLEGASILPSPDPIVPLVIGGSGAAAVRRTAEFGDGWLGIFCSSRRFAQTHEEILSAAADRGRPLPTWFGLSAWCGLDSDATAARRMVADQMQSLYNLPYEKFEHVTTSGTPEDVAEWFAPYVEAGARHLTIVPAAGSAHLGIEAVAEVRALLHKQFPAIPG